MLPLISDTSGIYGTLVQELLGDALIEAQHHREVQCLDSKNLILLKNQAQCAAVHADFVYTDLTQSSAQVGLLCTWQFAKHCFTCFSNKIREQAQHLKCTAHIVYGS